MTAGLPLAVSLGDPAGVGPEIVVKAWEALRGTGPAFFVIGDHDALAAESLVLQRITAPGLRLAIVKQIAELAGMTPLEVETLCDLKAQAAYVRAAPLRVARAPVTSLDEQMLRLLVRAPHLATLAETEEQRHVLPDGSPVLAMIDAICSTDNPVSSTGLTEMFAETDVAPFLRRALVEELEIDKEPAIVEAEFRHALKTLRDHWRRARTAQIISAEMAVPAARAELAALIAEEGASKSVASASTA